jgi:hypothetical protein
MEDSAMSSNYLTAVDDVLSVIRYLGQHNTTVELTKSFKGVEVHEDVSILEVCFNEAAFRISNTGMCAALEGDVYLHSRLFPKPVRAQIKSLNLNKGVLVLSSFAYIDNEWKKRRNERVQPKHPTYVTMHWKGKTDRPYVRNISADGMGLLAYKNLEKDMRIQPGSNVQLDFELPPENKYTALKGTVININAMGSSTSAIGMRLFPKAQDARFLERYVTQRKQEIIEELNQVFWELVMPRGVESLYF